MVSFHNVVTASDPETTVNEALRLLRNNAVSECVIIGIDPGDEPGIAVVANGITEAVYRVPLKRATEVVQKIRQEYPDVLVRIGHGARLVSTYLANALLAQGMRVELVDENGTSPYLGKGTAGVAVSDIVAAINIAHTCGIRIGRQEVSPSRGEIRWIQERSRELSEGQVTISRKLAERVAKGEMTISDALIEHAAASESKVS